MVCLIHFLFVDSELHLILPILDSCCKPLINLCVMLGLIINGRVLLWKPWLHWGLGLHFFFCKYAITCPSATVLVRKGSSERQIPIQSQNLLWICYAYLYTSGANSESTIPHLYPPAIFHSFWGLLWLIFHPCKHQIQIMRCKNSSTFEAKCGP